MSEHLTISSGNARRLPGHVVFEWAHYGSPIPGGCECRACRQNRGLMRREARRRDRTQPVGWSKPPYLDPLPVLGDTCRLRETHPCKRASP